MFDDEADTDESLPLRELRRIAGGACTDCRNTFTQQEAVFSIALGFKNAPRCLSCLATRLDREPDELREQLVRYILGRECYRKAWEEVERKERGEETPPTSSARQPTIDAAVETTVGLLATAEPQESWDAGGMGCGELVMALRVRLTAFPPGAVIRVVATDPAAPEDLPAWCRLTGHTLVRADHPEYVIRKKGA